MLKRADFWVGFLVAFVVLGFFPGLNLLQGMFGGITGNRGQG
jgi:hypothetical protein